MIRALNTYFPNRIIILVLTDALIVSGCFLLATFLILGPDSFIALNYEYGNLKLLLLTGTTLLIAHYCDLYETQLVADRRESYFRILFVLGFLCIIFSFLIFFFPAVSMSRYVFPLGFIFLACSLLLWRKVYGWIITKSIFREGIYVLGAGEYARSVVQHIESRKDLGMEVRGWDGISSTKEERRRSAAENLARLNAEHLKINRIIIAMEDRRGELPVLELLVLRLQGVLVEEAGPFLERLSGTIQLDGLRPSSFLFSEGFRVKPSQQLMRRVVSFTAATIGLLLFLPFFPFVVLAMRIESNGPIFFRQTRVGLGGKHFTVYKFRSMVQNAEVDGAKWAQQNDPRVTSIGRFMRKTRADEIPQLWNVLRGDMGLVGPRPERPEFVPWLSEQIPYYDMRHMIRPGLTGWAQVRFKYGVTLEDSRKKLQYDLYYVKHMSLGLDLLIMFETIKTIVRRRGAQ